MARKRGLIGPEADPFAAYADDPSGLRSWLWEGVTFYDKQQDVITSVLANAETVVVAGHQLGKDFVAAFVVLWYFLSHTPCRVVTTSVNDDHLRVLWGEINRYVETSKVPLPLVVTHKEIKRVLPGGQVCPVSYLIGKVSARGEGLQGHHAPHTLLVIDEASGVDDEVYNRGSTWAKRTLVVGNPYGGDSFFKRAARGGDRSDRKILKVTAADSPNVRRERMRREGVPENQWPPQLPGVLTAEEYERRLATWDAVRICVGINADWWEGQDALMFPPHWLGDAATRHDRLTLAQRADLPRAIGCDPAEGGDRSAWAVVDELGLLTLVSKKTPDTNVIPSETLGLMKHWGVPAERVAFDAGGGRQHADRLRSQGYAVRTVAFGEAVVPEPQRGRAGLAERQRRREDRHVYFNRRAQLYHDLRLMLDPARVQEGKAAFALPRGGGHEGCPYERLRRQLGPIPLRYDEGKLRLPPKRRKSRGGERSLEEMCGGSPDEADAVCLSLHALLHRGTRVKAGAF